MVLVALTWTVLGIFGNIEAGRDLVMGFPGGLKWMGQSWHAPVVMVVCLAMIFVLRWLDYMKGSPDISVEILPFGMMMRTIRVTNHSYDKPARLHAWRLYGVNGFAKRLIPPRQTEAPLIEGCGRSIQCEMPPGGSLTIKTAMLDASFTHKFYIAEVELEGGEIFQSKKSPVTLFIPKA